MDKKFLTCFKEGEIVVKVDLANSCISGGDAEVLDLSFSIPVGEIAGVVSQSICATLCSKGKCPREVKLDFGDRQV